MVVGKCPLCGKDVVEGTKCYYCSGFKKDDEDSCKFIIFKELAGKSIPSAQAKSLIEKGKTDLIKGFSGKKGKFDAFLVLENGKVNFLFPDKKNNK